MTKLKRSPFLGDFQRREVEDYLVSERATETHTDINLNITHSLPTLKSRWGFSHFYTLRRCGRKIKCAQQELFGRLDVSLCMSCLKKSW